jgi:hypothetical protein
MRSRAAAIAASAPRWARPIPSSSALDPSPRNEEIVVGRQVDALGPQTVGDPERERQRHRGALDPELPAGAGADLEVHVLALHPLGDHLVPPELLEGMAGDPVHLRDPLHLEGRDDRVPLAVVLHVQERIRHGHRNLVSELGGPQRVGPDQDVGQGGRESYRPT